MTALAPRHIRLRRLLYYDLLIGRLIARGDLVL